VKIGEKLTVPEGYSDQMKIYQTLDKKWIIDFSVVFVQNDLVNYVEQQLRSFGLKIIEVKWCQ